MNRFNREQPIFQMGFQWAENLSSNLCSRWSLRTNPTWKMSGATGFYSDFMGFYSDLMGLQIALLSLNVMGSPHHNHDLQTVQLPQP